MAGRLRPPENLPVSFDCRDKWPVLRAVLDQPVQQNAGTCWIHAPAVGWKCYALQQSGWQSEDLRELSHLCTEERVMRLCGVASAEDGGNPAHALECLTGAPPMRVGHGRTEHERVEEICRWIEHKGPVVSTGFEVTADFTGAPEGAYDTQSGHTTPRGLHAVVIDGWKKMPYGQWAWLVKNSWGDRLNHKEVPFGQDGIDAGVLGIPRFPLGYPAPSPIPRWRLAISGEPLCGPWRERDSTDSTSYHLCYYVERQTGERRLAFVATPGPDLCKCCVLPITSQARETGVHEGNGWLTEEFMDNSLLSSLGVRPDESGILWVSVRLRVTGEDELELSFKRQDRGYTMFVYERVRFSGSREGRSTLKELQSPVAPSYQPVYVVGEEGGGCGVPSPMLCD